MARVERLPDAALRGAVGKSGGAATLPIMAELDSSPKSIQTLYGWYADEKLWVNRRYQRKLVWTLEEKQRLVESILKGYPVPAVLLAEREAGDYEVIDGLQRLYTLMSFVETSFGTLDGRAFDVEQFPTAHTRSTEGRFSISDQYDDRLTPREVGTYLDYSMAVSIMRGATDTEIDDVFSRINTYGHQLSDQERRQAGVQNGFSNLVRAASSAVRGDASKDVLPLEAMPEISIDLPKAKHGYQVLASEVFWVTHGILRSTDLRDSMDEQCVADVAASVIGGTIIARSKDALDEAYRQGSDASTRIDTALTGYGADKFQAEFKFIIDEIRTLCETSDPPIKLRSLLFSRQTTNPFPALFTVLAIALHELLIVGNLKVTDYEAARSALKDLDKRIDTSRGSTSPEDRRKNVDTIKGLLTPHLVPAEGRSLYDNQSATDIDDAMRRSEIEAPHFEFKQGMLRLSEAKELDAGMPSKIVETVCAIANNGPGRTGALLLGVADSEADAQRVAEIYGVTPRKVGRKLVVGVRREADALGESLETYVQRIKDAIANSDLSDPLRSAVLASLSFNEYFGLGVLVVNVPAQTDVSTVADRIFVREGDSTVEVTGKALLDVAKRF